VGDRRPDLGGADGTLFQTMASAIDMVGFTAGARAAYALHRRVSLNGRLEVGTARTDLSLHAQGHTVSDAAWGGIATAAAGVEVLAIARRRFSFGARLELGYVAATAPSLSPRAEGDGTLELATMQASIGHLDLDGRFVMVSLLGQF